MRFTALLPTAIATFSIIAGSTIVPSQAIQLQDGTVYFVQPPRLVEAATTYNEVSIPGATYYFTVSIPENASEPLQKIIINQRGGVDDIEFDLKGTFAFIGNRSREGEKIAIKDVTRDKKTQTVSIIFDQPISPGQTVTLGLKPLQNPTVSGVYLFGVTASPPGEKTYNQFLGYARLQFYSHGFSRFF